MLLCYFGDVFGINNSEKDIKYFNLAGAEITEAEFNNCK